MPAYGFIPPISPAFRGAAEIRREGFAYSPGKAGALLADYFRETGRSGLDVELTFDAGELPNTIAQFVQAEWRKNLPNLKVTLRQITWPELLQQAFSGNGEFYRFWWNIVTPSEDLYFLFYFPGQNPPAGFNLSFYSDPDFVTAYYDAFGELDPTRRFKLVQGLENFLIKDAAAVPLMHRRYSFILSSKVSLPMNGYLRKYYAHASNGTTGTGP